ncbi:hypothetical protein GCM10022403_084280 [Streptomyces coacervatus]|uniref:HNH endonuclease n=1 Tax=Streptomyces coacervatus TaxID=647381 RepID=A0ABP7JAZ9_9ACTN|nr:hypothetical protein [Streptomyces coacervatus]MDF2273356.1 hypothetical protein [Streptomyces coacervatus]
MGWDVGLGELEASEIDAVLQHPEHLINFQVITWLLERFDAAKSTAKELYDFQAQLHSAASNRSKADQDPATWQPPAAGYRCTYATDWVAIKTHWGLAIDPIERAEIDKILRACPDSPVEVTLAR